MYAKAKESIVSEHEKPMVFRVFAEAKKINGDMKWEE